MDTRIKNALGIVGAIAIAIVTVAAWNGVSAVSRSSTSGATFSVTGNGKSVGVPDVAQFNFSVTNEGGKDIAALQEENVAKTNAAIDFLKSEGVQAKDIETQNYSIQPRYQSYDCRPDIIYQPTPVFATPPGTAVAPAVDFPQQAPRPCPPASIVGYTVMQTVEVKIRDFSKTGEIIAGVADKGANSISGLNFTTDDPNKLHNEARGKAIQDAREQAQAIAQAGGFRLGRLVSVNDVGGYAPQYVSFAKELAADGVRANAPAPNIEPGSQEANSQVILTYEIK